MNTTENGRESDVQDAEVLALIRQLTPKQQAIVAALKMGNTRAASYGFAGVSKTTFYRWMEDAGPFAEAVQQAEASAEVAHVACIAAAAAAGDWRASEAWLKRRRREDWGDNVCLDIDREIMELMAQLSGDGGKREREEREGPNGTFRDTLHAGAREGAEP